MARLLPPRPTVGPALSPGFSAPTDVIARDTSDHHSDRTKATRRARKG